VNFLPFEITEGVLSENIVALEELSDRDPQVQLLQKLRQAFMIYEKASRLRDGRRWNAARCTRRR
jgi:hypothetical protein